jgi:alkaline phosphatase
MKKLLFLFLIALLTACHPRQEAKSPGVILETVEPVGDTLISDHPKNIILMIGDGMGLTQITAGMYVNGNNTNLEQFSFIGLHKSYASNDLITDSAAGATAIASGVKTYNGAIGVDKTGKPVKTILEEAESLGLSTGLVVTSSITHATPACFYAHQKDRTMMEAIALDLVNAGVDFFVGGGKRHFVNRVDERNLLQELQQQGVEVADFLKSDFNNLSIDFGKPFAYFTANDEPLPLSQGRDYFLQATQTALTYLSGHNEKGFFLMIEGSQIDWGGHANNSDYIISEMIEFDKAIGLVLDFAKENGKTLVIVTADHEAGGYAINPGSKMDSIVPAFTTDKHTGTLIPVFAWGAGAELFGGIYENTTIYDKMRRAFGFEKT